MLTTDVRNLWAGAASHCVKLSAVSSSSMAGMVAFLRQHGVVQKNEGVAGKFEDEKSQRPESNVEDTLKRTYLPAY